MKRGAVQKSNSRMVTLWMPTELIPVIDEAAAAEDTDRSKFIRRAVREKIDRQGTEDISPAQ